MCEKAGAEISFDSSWKVQSLVCQRSHPRLAQCLSLWPPISYFVSIIVAFLMYIWENES